MNRQPRIAVLTQNCFSQCDLPVLPRLLDGAEVRWDVFYPRDDLVGRSERDLESAARTAGIATRCTRLPGRLRSPSSIATLWRILSDIAAFEPDTLYVNAVGLPWLAPMVRAMFSPRKVVWAVHDVEDHRFNRFYQMPTLYRKFLYRAFRRFHFLSKGQEELFRSRFPRKTTVYAPHAPLDFGPRTGEPGVEPVRFLFFGFIAPRKGVDVLVEAAEILHARGHAGFKVAIAGKCADWAPYASGIRTPELFELDIRPVPNERVVDLYSGAHWLVLPYRDITQSGPLSLAMNYEVPTITSDLEGFGEFVRPGETGLSFALDDPGSLAEAMRQAMDLELWRRMREGQRAWFGERFSLDRCASLYSGFLMP